VLSEVDYYLETDTLRAVLHRERVRFAETVIAAHWRHAVDDYPMSADQTNEIIADNTVLAATAIPTWLLMSSQRVQRHPWQHARVCQERHGTRYLSS